MKALKAPAPQLSERALSLLPPQWVPMSDEQRQQAIAALAELLLPLLENHREDRAA